MLTVAHGAQVVPFYQAEEPAGPGARYRALVLDSSYRPIDVVSWQRAICLDLFDKVRILLVSAPRHWRLCGCFVQCAPCSRPMAIDDRVSRLTSTICDRRSATASILHGVPYYRPHLAR